MLMIAQTRFPLALAVRMIMRFATRNTLVLATLQTAHLMQFVTRASSNSMFQGYLCDKIDPNNFSDPGSPMTGAYLNTGLRCSAPFIYYLHRAVS